MKGDDLDGALGFDWIAQSKLSIFSAVMFISDGKVKMRALSAQKKAKASPSSSEISVSGSLRVSSRSSDPGNEDLS